MRPIARGSAGKDSVEVFRIPLRFHQSFASAIGTAGKIVQRRVTPIECADDSFGLNACLMNCTIAEIDELFGMTDGPGCAHSTIVTVVGCSGGIALSQRIGQRAIRNAPGPTTVTYLLILPVPSGHGKPHGGLDFGILARTNRQLNLTVSRRSSNRFCRRDCRSG